MRDRNLIKGNSDEEPVQTRKQQNSNEKKRRGRKKKERKILRKKVEESIEFQGGGFFGDGDYVRPSLEIYPNEGSSREVRVGAESIVERRVRVFHAKSQFPAQT